MPDPIASARNFAERQLLSWRLWRTRRTQSGNVAAIKPGSRVAFRCNLCGTPNQCRLNELSREAASCARCSSNVRFRAMAYLVTKEVLGRPALLPELATRNDICGLGLSDSETYAQPLAERFAYENSFFHADPRVDINDVDPARFGRYDFLIASDVFEHVVPPVSRAFENSRRLLKPGGRFIFSVPFSLDAATREHFPDLFDWSLSEQDGNWTLTNRTVDGREETFTDLVFHEGPGTTLEMRMFCLSGLEHEFSQAGFARVRVADEPYLPFGISWLEPWSLPMVAYAE